MPDRVAVLIADLFPRASKRESAQSASSPPQSVAERIRCVIEVPFPPAPGFPLCATGLPPDCVALVSKGAEPGPVWGVEFEIGRRRYDAQHSGARHALFELFVSIERAMGPAYRLPLREPVSALRSGQAAEDGPRGVGNRVSVDSVARVR